jgi:hypothetical protein
VSAVALEGFGELSATLRSARQTAGSPDAEPRTVASAYLEFAQANPAVYGANVIGWVSVDDVAVFARATYRRHAAEWAYFIDALTRPTPSTWRIGRPPSAYWRHSPTESSRGPATRR